MTERQPGSDPIGELQRWLVRSGARSVTRGLGDQVRTALGGNTRGDVWEDATADHEAPECQWCPICRAARRYRDGGGTATPDLGSQLAGVGDVLAGFTKDAFSLFEAAVRNPQRPPGAAGTQKPPGAATSSAPSAPGASSDDGPVVGPGVTWAAAVVHAEHEDSEPADEGGHGEEDGEPGDAAADSGGDEQVEGSAE